MATVAQRDLLAAVAVAAVVVVPLCCCKIILPWEWLPAVAVVVAVDAVVVDYLHQVLAETRWQMLHTMDKMAKPTTTTAVAVVVVVVDGTE